MEASVSSSATESASSHSLSHGKRKPGAGADAGLPFLSIFADANAAPAASPETAALNIFSGAKSTGNALDSEENKPQILESSAQDALPFDMAAWVSAGGASSATSAASTPTAATPAPAHPLSAGADGAGGKGGLAQNAGTTPVASTVPSPTEAAPRLTEASTPAASTALPADIESSLQALRPAGAAALAKAPGLPSNMPSNAALANALPSSQAPSTAELNMRWMTQASQAAQTAATLQNTQGTSSSGLSALTLAREQEFREMRDAVTLPWADDGLPGAEGRVELRSLSTGPVAGFVSTVGLAGGMNAEGLAAAGSQSGEGGSSSGQSHSGSPDADIERDAKAQAEEEALQEQLEQWSQEAMDVAEATLRQGGQAVQVQVALAGKEAQVLLRSDEAQLRERLQQEREQLRQDLEAQGLELKQLDVGSSGTESDAQGNDAAQAERAGQHLRAQLADASSDPATPASAAAPIRPVREGGIDTFA